MKKLLFIGLIALTMMATIGCGGKKQTAGDEFYQDSTDVVAAEKPTIYGVAVKSSTGDTLEIIIDNGDTLFLNIARAREDQRIMGIIQEGDRMIVLCNPEKTIGETVINQNMLLGDWIMPDPIDGSTDVGISIKEGGIAESIELTNISYRTWKIIDGMLEITSIREGGSQEEEVNYYNITKLTADSLTYKDEEDTYEYSRYKPKEGYGVDTELEESSLEEFMMN